MTMLCHLCGVDVTLAQAGYYRVHFMPGGERCPASRMTPDVVLAQKQTFKHRDRPNYQTMTVVDDVDTITLHNRLVIDDMRTELWFAVQPHDIRRFIAEMTEIADKRGL